MVIAIDGPAGAGKSTVARAVAAALGFTYLDTGAMYRCVALAELRGAEHPERADIALGGRVQLDGDDVTDEIRSPEVSERASQVAARSEVRRAMQDRQRALLSDGDWVAEGRDIGTVVCPGAEVKVFLTADDTERARRRAEQIGADLATVLADQQVRDARDRERADSPLVPAGDAIELDTTGLSIDDVVGRIGDLAAAARAGSTS